MTTKATTFMRRAAVTAAVAAVGATGVLAGAGHADAKSLPGGYKKSVGIDGQVVEISRKAESVRAMPSVANNGAGRSAAVSGTFSTKLSKGKGTFTVGYLVGCQVNISGMEGGISGTITSSGPSLSGSLSVPLKPGEVKFVKSDALSLKKGKGTIMVDSFQIDVQQCGGAASARSVAQVLAADGFSTDDDKLTGDSGFVQSTLYGRTFSLN